jgi:radical SAM/Cys-rich protein
MQRIGISNKDRSLEPDPAHRPSAFCIPHSGFERADFLVASAGLRLHDCASIGSATGAGLQPKVNRFLQRLAGHQLALTRARTEVLQVNVGKLCNLTCNHCHVNAGPKRTEIMARPTIDRVLDWLARTEIPTVDITGGAPEMIPDFRYFVETVRSLTPGRHVIDRCNLTILLEPGYTDLATFLARNEVEIIASLPCYTPKNVNEQRGDGVFDGSIRALQLLNKVGYGTKERLPLHLVYNPNGAFLPGPQAELEADYKRELKKHFGIVFNRLYTITNMPIARFAAYLRRHGEYDEYMELLAGAFNPHTVPGLMCRTTLSVGWQGEVYDCDFNQMLDLQCHDGRPLYLWDVEPARLEDRAILTGDHCFGCTAGCGSSCGGALAGAVVA